MHQIDDELRRAMRRVDAPEGLADRVRERIGKTAAEPASPQPFAVARAGWAIAATLVLAVAGGMWYRAEEQRRAQGEEAKRQVLLSLNIAGSKLRAIEMKLNQREER